MAADPLPGNPVPVELAFETAHATDDLLCTLSDGTRLFISAKRACGNNIHLVNTVGQWLRQVDQLQSGDRLVLATAAPAGIVRQLGNALQRRRDAPDSVFPAPEADALAALRTRMDGTPADKQDRVLDAAVVLVIDAGDAGRPGYQLAAALLEGTVVPAGYGGAAVSHLQAHLHTQAGLAYTGDVESWVDHLTDLGMPVFADRSGPAAAAIRARRVAVDHYRANLETVAGQVDLSLLAEDLEPLIIDGLVDHLQVTVPTPGRSGDTKEVHLAALARRIPRLLVEGLPGSGKSAAIAQIAAKWAAESAAPLPIVVRLRELANVCRVSSDVSLTRLCELAAAHAPQRERADLVEAMHTSVARGEAVLLLDGLDECLDRRALVAQGLKPVLAALPPETGVLLTTRPSAMSAADRLSLEVAHLSAPENLDDVLDQLLRQVAQIRVPASAREAWVAERSKRVHNIRKTYRGLGSVPLLAVLIALVVAEDSSTALPSTTAGVLKAAVTQTIDRWERRRPHLPDTFSERPTSEQLLIGFASIGHLLSHRTAASAAEVESAIAAAMTARWHLAPEPAAEVARTIQWFWDDHVGVFVADADGNVAARSRVFTEIGAAMWCPSMTEPGLRAWVSTAAGDPNGHTALLLAVELDVRVIGELLTPSDDTDDRCRLAATALGSGVAFRIDQTERLLTQLAERATLAADSSTGTPSTRAGTERAGGRILSAAELIDGLDDRRMRRDGPVWPWALEIARLRIPVALEARRAELLATVTVTEDQRLIAGGIAALVSADTAARPLSSEEHDRVLRMLSVPLPPMREKPPQASRRRFTLGGHWVGLTEGLGQATARAVIRLTELDPRAVELISAIAKEASRQDGDDIAAAMSRHGHDLNLHALSSQTMAMFIQVSNDIREGEQVLIETASRLSQDEILLTASQRWRLPDLCDFLDRLDGDGTAIPDFRAAVQVDTEQTRATWMRCMALAAGLDLAVLAAQARVALAEITDGGIHAVVQLIYAARLGEDQDLAGEQLLPAFRQHLLSLLTAESDWIARSATRLLWSAQAPGLADEIAGILANVPPQRRVLLAVLCWSVSEKPDIRLRTFFDSEDPALRRAAASASRERDNPEVMALRARALLDEDATIRLAAGATSLDDPETPTPQNWSCQWCAELNEFEADDCRGCDKGTRPHANDT